MSLVIGGEDFVGNVEVPAAPDFFVEAADERFVFRGSHAEILGMPVGVRARQRGVHIVRLLGAGALSGDGLLASGSQLQPVLVPQSLQV